MITHDLLLILGFRQLLFQPNRYEYKGIEGQLTENGHFHLDGLSIPLEEPEDVQFILVLIDQPPTGGVTPFSDN